MKLLNPRGNMIKMNFRTAKSGQNVTNSLSLTDWNASRSSRRTEVQGRGRVLTEVWTWNVDFSVFPEFKKLIIKIKFGLWENLQLAKYLCKSIALPPLHESSDTGSCKNHASKGRAGSSLPSSARGGKWDNSQSQGGSPLPLQSVWEAIANCLKRVCLRSVTIWKVCSWGRPESGDSAKAARSSLSPGEYSVLNHTLVTHLLWSSFKILSSLYLWEHNLNHTRLPAHCFCGWHIP